MQPAGGALAGELRKACRTPPPGERCVEFTQVDEPTMLGRQPTALSGSGPQRSRGDSMMTVPTRGASTFYTVTQSTAELPGGMAHSLVSNALGETQRSAQTAPQAGAPSGSPSAPTPGRCGPPPCPDDEEQGEPTPPVQPAAPPADEGPPGQAAQPADSGIYTGPPLAPVPTPGAGPQQVPAGWSPHAAFQGWAPTDPGSYCFGGYSEKSSPLIVPPGALEAPGGMRHVASELVLEDLQGGVTMGYTHTPPLHCTEDPDTVHAIPPFRIKVRRHYWVGPLLGEGAYGKVRLAVDSRTGGTVAIKSVSHHTLRRIRGGDEALRREIAILRRVAHRHVIRLLDSFQREDKPKTHLVLTYCLASLEALCDAARRAGKRSVDGVRRLAAELLLGLDYLHRQARVAHRDIKLANLMITPAHPPELVISDFGQAVELPESGDLMPPPANATPAYVPPEVAAGTDGPIAATRADVWAAGVVVFSLLALRLPFDGASEAELYHDIEQTQVDVAAAAAGALQPSSCAEVLDRMLAKSPSRRPSAEQLLRSEWLSAAPTPQLHAKASFSQQHQSAQVQQGGPLAQGHSGQLPRGCLWQQIAAPPSPSLQHRSGTGPSSACPPAVAADPGGSCGARGPPSPHNSTGRRNFARTARGPFSVPPVRATPGCTPLSIGGTPGPPTPVASPQGLRCSPHSQAPRCPSWSRGGTAATADCDCDVLQQMRVHDAQRLKSFAVKLAKHPSVAAALHRCGCEMLQGRPVAASVPPTPPCGQPTDSEEAAARCVAEFVCQVSELGLSASPALSTTMFPVQPIGGPPVVPEADMDPLPPPASPLGETMPVPRALQAPPAAPPRSADSCVVM